MCEPLTAIAIAATVASTAISTIGAMKQQDASNKAAQYNADIQRRNADIANMQADTAIKEGQVEVNRHDLAVKGMIGTQRAEGAASGLLTDEGSNLSTQEDTAAFGKLDSLTIQNNAAREAWGIRNQAANYDASANLLESSKGSTALAGASPLLSGISSLGTKLYTAKQTGAFD